MLRLDRDRDRAGARVFTTALLAAVLAAGCGDDPEEGLGGPIAVAPGPVGAGTTGGTGGVQPTTGGTATTGGTLGGAPVAPVDGGVAQPNPTGGTAGGGAGAGGSLDTPWCKVKAILDKNCKGCHTSPPAGGAPFPLVTIADLTAAHPSKAGKKIYERVAFRMDGAKSQSESLGVMPPGKQLPAEDLATVNAWVSAGAPAGDNPTCVGAAPPVDPAANEVWPLPECDAVYKITAHGAGGIDTPAMAPPGQESHPQVAWDAPWGDEQVQAIAFKTITDNAEVLHHWILSGRPGGFLTGWAPGEDGVRKMKPDVGMLMPTGKGSLNLDMHYYNTQGTMAKPDKSGVEVCVVKKAKFRKNNAAVTMSLASIGDFLGGGLAPANSSNHEVKASCTVGGSQPITLLSASPHAHKYAVRMKFTLKRKSGEELVMHDMPFMFGEQKSYALEPPIVVQPGDVINTSCFYTNKTNRNITFGESTENEMCFNFAMYYPAGALTCSGGGGLIGGLGGGGGGFVSF